MKYAAKGAMVFDYLKKAKEGRTALEIAADTGLSYPQVMDGIRHIKEVLGVVHSEPIIYTPYVYRRGTSLAQHTYRLAATAKQVKTYEAWRLGIHVKQLRNLALIGEAGMDKFGDAELGVLLHSLKQAADTAEFVQKQLLGVK